MRRVNFAGIFRRIKGPGRNPRLLPRVILGALAAANLVAAVFVLKPWAGSAEDLERQASSLRQQLRRTQTDLERLRGIVSKVETARSDGDRFMDGYLLGRRSVSSTLLADLETMARKASIRQKEVTFAFEPIEGSDTLTKAVITAAYEGTYADLMHFLNLLDRSQRLLIIESLSATPQPQGLVLGVTIRLNAFVREGGPPPAQVASAESGPEPDEQPAAGNSEKAEPVDTTPAPPAAAAQEPPPPAPAPFAPPTGRPMRVLGRVGAERGRTQ